MAAAAHPLSFPGENTSLHVFNVPVTDVSIVSSKWVDYEPVQTGTNLLSLSSNPWQPILTSRKFGLSTELIMLNDDRTEIEKLTF